MTTPPPAADTALRMFAGATDALIPFMLLALAPVHLWLRPDLQYSWDGTVEALYLAVWAGYYTLYSFLPHWRWRKTLGKRIFRLSVVNTDASDCACSTLLVREFFRGASLGVLSIPLVYLLQYDATLPHWGEFGVFTLLYVLLGAPVVTAVILCPIVSSKRGLHDYAVETMVISEAPKKAVEPLKDMQGAAIVFAMAPALLIAAALSPDTLTFLGILVVSVIGFAIVRALYERSRR